MTRRWSVAAAVPLLAALSACVHAPIDTVAPSIETLRLLREQKVPPIALGMFSAAEAARERSINIRGSTLRAPKGGDFSRFLRQAFEAELKAAGTFDPAAETELAATLIESRAQEDLSKGKASLAARIMVFREGKMLFGKIYRTETLWKSDFIGAIAIPEAFRQYNALYAGLVRKVFADPDFIAAVKS